MLSSRTLSLFRQIGSCLRKINSVQQRSFFIDDSMPKSKEYLSSSDDSDSSGGKASKKKRRSEKESEERARSSKKPKTLSKQDEAEPSWEIGRNRFIKVRDFKGKTYVDIREMYMDSSSGDLKPGKKGICLDIPQWRKLMEHVEEVDKVVKTKC